MAPRKDAAVLFPGVVSVIRVLAPPQFPARAQGIQGAAFSPGAMAPYLVLPFFGARAWVASFLMVALMPALLRLSLLWRTRVIAAQNPPRQQRQHMAVPQNRCQIKTALVSRLQMCIRDRPSCACPFAPWAK